MNLYNGNSVVEINLINGKAELTAGYKSKHKKFAG